MWTTSWKRLLGMALAIPALVFMFILPFADGCQHRRKGFKAPLIDVDRLPLAAVCGAVVLLGVSLFLWGRKRPTK